jgi:hypothetical protein
LKATETEFVLRIAVPLHMSIIHVTVTDLARS